MCISAVAVVDGGGVAADVEVVARSTDRSNIFCHSKICHRVIPSFKLTAICELEDKETLSVIGNTLMGIRRDCRFP